MSQQVIDAYHRALLRSPTVSPELRALTSELLLRRGLGCCGRPGMGCINCTRPGMSGLGDAAADLMAQSAAAYNVGDYVRGAQLQQAAAMAAQTAAPQTSLMQDIAAVTRDFTSILTPVAGAGINAYRQFTGQPAPQQQRYVADNLPGPSWTTIALILGGIGAAVGIGIAASSRGGGGGTRRRRRNPPKRRLVIYRSVGRRSR